MTFTEMKEIHVAQVAELEKLCFADPWSEKSIASELNNIWAYWVVALDGDQVVGYIGSQSSADESDVMNVAVHPDYRRRGIAESLIGCLIQELKNEFTNEQRKFSFFCAHDCTVLGTLSALGVEDYTLPDSIETKTPIGVKLLFERWRDADGEHCDATPEGDCSAEGRLNLGDFSTERLGKLLIGR